MTPLDVAECRRWAAFYRSRGFNPLPSRTDAKRPLVRFADLWEKPLPAGAFDRFETSNVQVMTGRRWGLLVIDLDGPEAAERFDAMGPVPPTWASHSGGGGRHLWFAVPTEGRPLPKAFLWRGDGGHSAIERLCDRSLILAPPSIHPKTGRRYRWLDKRRSPLGMGKPAPCPAWVLQLAPEAARVEPIVSAPVAARPSRSAPGRAPGPWIPWRDVVARLDVPAVARSWGVRTVGEPQRRPSGTWLPCHAIDRPDAHPSAAIHVETGAYIDSGSGLKLRFCELAVALGVYATDREAFEDLRGSHV